MSAGDTAAARARIFRLAPLVRDVARGAGRRFDLRMVDMNCLAYVSLVGLGIVLFRFRVPGWPRELAIHAAMVLSILGLLRLHGAHPSIRIVQLARLLYPVGCLAYAWSEIDRLAPMAFGSYWATGALLRADRAIFGGLPFGWCQAHFHPLLDEAMNVCYSGYYFFMPAVCLFLLFRGKRQELLSVLSIVSFALLGDFVLFYLFPALSPRMIPGLIDPGRGDYGGYLFAAVTRLAQDRGAVRGGCFPSSHVVGAIAWTCAAWRADRRLGLALAPLAAGVVPATVYLMYHHAVDAIAGVAVGFVLVRIAIAMQAGRPAPAFCYDHTSHGILHPSWRPDAQPEGDRPLDPVREAHGRYRRLRLG